MNNNYLKLEQDFFKREEIEKMMQQPMGKDMVTIYLKMMLLSINNQGFINHDSNTTLEEYLAAELEEDIEIIKKSLEYFQNEKLILTDMAYVFQKVSSEFFGGVFDEE